VEGWGVDDAVVSGWTVTVPRYAAVGIEGGSVGELRRVLIFTFCPRDTGAQLPIFPQILRLATRAAIAFLTVIKPSTTSLACR